MGDNTAVDRILLRYSGSKTPNEISELTGLKPADVADRTLELLDQIDYFTLPQRRAKLMIQLEEIVAEVSKRAPDAKDRDLGALLNASRGTISTLLKELREIEREAKEDEDQMLDAFSRRMVSMYEGGIQRLLGRLEERYPDVDSTEVVSEFQEVMLELAREADLEAIQ